MHGLDSNLACFLGSKLMLTSGHRALSGSRSQRLRRSEDPRSQSCEAARAGHFWAPRGGGGVISFSCCDFKYWWSRYWSDMVSCGVLSPNGLKLAVPLCTVSLDWVLSDVFDR